MLFGGWALLDGDVINHAVGGADGGGPKWTSRAWVARAESPKEPHRDFELRVCSGASVPSSASTTHPPTLPSFA